MAISPLAQAGMATDLKYTPMALAAAAARKADAAVTEANKQTVLNNTWKAKLDAAKTTAQFNDLVKSAKAAGATLDQATINQSLNTVKQLEVKAAADAKIAKATAQAKAVADAQAADRAAADAAARKAGFANAEQQAARAAADKAAADKAAADKAAAQARIAEANDAADKVAQAQGYANQADMVRAQNAAKAAAQPVAPVVPAKLTAAQQQAADEAARAAKIEAARQADILARQQRAEKEAADEAARQAKMDAAAVADLKTKPAFQASIQKVIDSGQPLTQAAILAQHDTDVAAAKTAAAEKAQSDAVLAKKTDEYNYLSQTAKSQSQLDDIVAKAQAEGVTINSGYLDRATQAVQQMDARATADQLAQQKKTVDTSNFLNNLPQPGSAEFAQKANQGAIITGPMGSDFMAIPANAVTGEPGRWLISGDGGRTYYQAGAKPDTAVSGYAASQQFRQTQTQNFDLINQQAAAARAAQAEAAAHKNDFTWDDFGKVLGVVAVAALGVYALGAIGEGALATEAASTAGGMAAEGATAGEITSTLTAGGVAPEAAASIANTATGIATGTVDAAALAEAGGVTAETLATAEASANPLASITQTLTELDAAQTAELMKNIDPNMISSLAPTGTGTAAGTAGSILEGTSLNPITNVLTNLGVTNPIISGALTGAGTGAAINTLTGKPITGDSLLMGALGGGVAGGIGSVLPDFGGGTLGAGLAGAATNVGATIVVNAVTGQPITASTLAGAALTGGVIGAGIQVATDGAGNSTYQYEDGSSMTTNRQGTPVAATDSTGATVPVAAVDSRTGQPKQLAPVEEAQPKTPEQIAAEATPPGPVAPPARVDLNNITQEQLNQTLSENNPYLESKPIQTVAVAPTETQTDTTPVADMGEITVTDKRPEPVEPVYIPELINTQPVAEPPLSPVQTVNVTPSEPIPEVQAPEQPVNQEPTQPVAPVYPPVYVPPIDTTPKTPTYGPLDPTRWGTAGQVNLPGLNPGFITNVPRYYNNPSPVAAQYYWGQHPYQAGQTFDRGLYNTLPVAPATPFGLQQMYDPQSQTIQNLLRGVGQASAVAPYNQPAAPRV